MNIDKKFSYKYFVFKYENIIKGNKMRISSFVKYIIFSFMFAAAINACGDKEIKEVQPDSAAHDFWVGDTLNDIHGIDVSHHQKEIEWDKVKAHGVTFVFVKATEGIDYIDTMFSYNWKNLEREKMIRGAYHFFVSDDDPVEQADWFVKNVGSFDNILPPVIDAERAGHQKITPEEYKEKLIKCLVHVEKLTGKQPIIYSGPNFAEKYLAHQDFGKYKLWIAEYGVDQPKIPDAWQNNGWQFWQNTFKANVPGVPAEVDRNVFSDKFNKLLEMVN